MARVQSNRGFAVGSMINEHEDGKTLVIKTGFQNHANSGNPDLEALVRVHYARWFQLMGLWPQAFALFARRLDNEEIRFLPKRIGRTRFLFPDVPSIPFRYNVEPAHISFLHPLQPVHSWEGRPLILGLEENVATTLFSSIRHPHDAGNAHTEELLPDHESSDYLESESEGRVTAFRDGAIAMAYQQFSETEMDGEPIYL